MTEDNILVTDSLVLFQFSKNDYKLVRKTDTDGGGERQLYGPRGLCTDDHGDVYVAEHWKDRVSVLSKDLNFINYLFAQQLENPQDVKVTQNSVVVLDQSPNCIHFFSRSGGGGLYDVWSAVLLFGSSRECPHYRLLT